MKSIATKVSAIFAMLISLVSFGLLISAFVVSFTEAPAETGGVSRSFALWVYAVIVAIISLIFYTIDAIFSIIKAFMKIHPVFHLMLAAILLGGIPMCLFVGGGLGINIYIWFSYYLLMFVLEIVSIVQHVKMMKTEEK